MVCCAFLTVLVAAVLWLVARIVPGATAADPDPLAWRPYARPPVDAPPRPAPFTVSARLRSFGFALQGLRTMLRYQHNARIHLAATLGIVAVGLAVGISGADWRWIAAAVVWVWFAEAMNTAFEHLCDVVSPDRNESVRLAKDIAAGAVLISAIGAVILGAITLLPYIVALVSDGDADLWICRATP